jgi:hypothetical protein
MEPQVVPNPSSPTVLQALTVPAFERALDVTHDSGSKRSFKGLHVYL